MELAEIEREALTLSETDRATLAARLLDTLPPSDVVISGEEVERRERELDSGTVQAISHEELVRRVMQERSTN
jgi:hypothetical protein